VRAALDACTVSISITSVIAVVSLPVAVQEIRIRTEDAYRIFYVAKFKDAKQRKNHAGRANESTDLYASDTVQAIDNAFKLKIRDLVRNAISIITFGDAVADLQASKNDTIAGHPAKAVEVTAKAIGLSSDESSLVLNHLIRSGDLSRFGMLNAVTRSAEDIQSYDRWRFSSHDPWWCR
jgi:hypothetical protein